MSRPGSGKVGVPTSNIFGPPKGYWIKQRRLRKQRRAISKADSARVAAQFVVPDKNAGPQLRKRADVVKP